jgi:hypothetical protein
MDRGVWRRIALLGLVWISIGGAGPAEPSGVPLPPGVRPLTGPVTLRYAPPERFVYGWRADIITPRGPVIAEGWVMDATARREDDGITWTYRLLNIGLDEVLRERGSLEVTTDAQGEVRSARLLEDHSPPRPGVPRAGQDAMFDPEDLAFPLCCCPDGPLRQGQLLTVSPHSATLPGPLSREGLKDGPEGLEGLEIDRAERQAIVAGQLERGGWRYLVIRLTGLVRGRDAEAAFRIELEGYLLLDMASCMPTELHRMTRVTAMQAGRVTPSFAIVTRARVRE